MHRQKSHFVIALLLLAILLGCSPLENDSINLKRNSISTITYNKVDKNVTSIDIDLKSPLESKNKFLYLKGGQYKIDVVINTSDTIKFNEVQITKKPFDETLLLSERQLHFKLYPIPFDTLKSIEIIQHNRVHKKFAKPKQVLLVNEKGFNQKFRKNDELKTINFPLIKITTKETILDIKQNASFVLFENPTDTLNQINSDCTIKIRGNTSKEFKKKGFKIELTDSINRNKSLLGMPAEHDWVLHGPIIDISLIRNKIAYDLSREIGYYAPRCEFTELIVNNEYLGIYLLTENIKRDKNRVNIPKHDLTKDSIDSYIIKIDRGDDLLFPSLYKSEIDSGWKSYYYPVYPKSKHLSRSHKLQIKKEIHTFEKVLLEEKPINNVINIPSFINFFIINEVTKNIDAYRLSTFMHKDSTGINMGPVWDFNYSLGLTKHNNGHPPEGWVYEGDAVPFYWNELLKQQAYRNQLSQRWTVLRESSLKTASIHAMVDEQTNSLSPALQRNFKRWNVFNSNLWVRQYSVRNYDEEITYIKEWIEKRLIWMDAEIKEL